MVRQTLNDVAPASRRRLRSARSTLLDNTVVGRRGCLSLSLSLVLQARQSGTLHRLASVCVLALSSSSFRQLTKTDFFNCYLLTQYTHCSSRYAYTILHYISVRLTLTMTLTLTITIQRTEATGLLKSVHAMTFRKLGWLRFLSGKKSTVKVSRPEDYGLISMKLFIYGSISFSVKEYD